MQELKKVLGELWLVEIRFPRSWKGFGLWELFSEYLSRVSGSALRLCASRS